MSINIKITKARFKFQKSILFRIDGTSMIPFYQNKQEVRIVNASDSFVVGESYLFVYRWRLYFHRLLKKNNGKYIFAGDNSPKIQTVNKNDIIGKSEAQPQFISRILINLINYFLFPDTPYSIVKSYIRRLMFSLLKGLS